MPTFKSRKNTALRIVTGPSRKHPKMPVRTFAFEEQWEQLVADASHKTRIGVLTVEGDDATIVRQAIEDHNKGNTQDPWDIFEVADITEEEGAPA